MIVQPNKDLDNGRRDKMLDLMQEATVTTTLLYSPLTLEQIWIVRVLLKTASAFLLPTPFLSPRALPFTPMS